MQQFNLKIFLLTLWIVVLVNCSGEKKGGQEESSQTAKSEQSTSEANTPSDPMMNKGIGPVKNVDLSEEIDEEMAAKGKEVYENMCTACHKPHKRYIGPAPAGILERRSPEWIMNMILNPTEMVEKDPIAKKLLAEFNGAPMANQNLTREQARQILEYFRTLKEQPNS